MELSESELIKLVREIERFNKKLTSLSRSSRYRGVVLPTRETVKTVTDRISTQEDFEKELNFLKSIENPQIVNISGYDVLNTLADNYSALLSNDPKNWTVGYGDKDNPSYVDVLGNRIIIARKKFKTKRDLRNYLYRITLQNRDAWNFKRAKQYRENMVQTLEKMGNEDLAKAVASCSEQQIDTFTRYNPELFKDLLNWYNYTDAAKEELYSDVEMLIQITR